MSWDTQSVHLNGDVGQTGTWTRFPATGSYWNKLQTVDEDTTYVECTAVGIITFDIVQFTIPAESTFDGDRWVTLSIRLKGVDGADVDCEVGISIYGTWYWSPDNIVPGAAYNTHGPNWEVNPITGGLWTREHINAIDKCAVSCTNANDKLRITQVYLYATYYPVESEDYRPVNIPDYELTTLEALRNIEMSAMGRTYVDEQGNLKYESRYARNP